MRTENTTLTYAKALKEFSKISIESDIDPETCPVRSLTEDLFLRFIIHIQITQRYAHINDDELEKGYYEIFEKKGIVNDPQYTLFLEYLC